MDLAAAEERFAALRERFGDGGRPGARPAGRGGARRGAGGVSPPARAACWWRRQWWRWASMCPTRLGDGDRARRTLRPGAVASVARPGGPRRRRQLLPAAARGLGERHGAAAADAAARHRGRLRHRRRGFPPARRRRFAGHASSRGCRDSGWPIRSSTRGCCTWRTATRRCCWGRTRSWSASAAGRCACCCECSRRRRPCGHWRRGEEFFSAIGTSPVESMSTSSSSYPNGFLIPLTARSIGASAAVDCCHR